MDGDNPVMPNPFTYDKDILGNPDITRDDVLGTGIFGGAVMSGEVKCIVCGEFRVSGIIVCDECNEYVCDNHIYRHPNCSTGR